MSSGRGGRGKNNNGKIADKVRSRSPFIGLFGGEKAMRPPRRICTGLYVGVFSPSIGAEWDPDHDDFDWRGNMCPLSNRKRRTPRRQVRFSTVARRSSVAIGRLVGMRQKCHSFLRSPTLPGIADLWTTRPPKGPESRTPRINSASLQWLA